MINAVTGDCLKTISVAKDLHRGTLTQNYWQHGPDITPLQKLRMCRELLAALFYTWEKGLVHLDVKFDNVLVADDG